MVMKKNIFILSKHLLSSHYIMFHHVYIQNDVLDTNINSTCKRLGLMLNIYSNNIATL